MRLVHAADLHLDSPLRGLSRLGDADLADALRLASRRACENLVDLVLDERAAALLLAGDIYDGDWRDYQTGMFFVRQMTRLEEAEIPVFLISGNHDAASEITRTLRLPSNVRVMSTAEPETVVREDLGLAVHGQGFATRAVTENLVRAYPQRRSDLVNVGLLHTSVQGAAGHDNYAPCSPEDLEACCYEYFALGHVHHGNTVCDGEYVAAFSGNLQGRHPKEEGVKGAFLVDVEPGSRAVLRHRALDVARWRKTPVDVSDCHDLDDVMDLVQEALAVASGEAGSRTSIVQLTLVGATSAAAALLDTDRVRAEVDLRAEKTGTVVDAIRNRTQNRPTASVIDPELTSSVVRAAAEMAEDPDRVADLIAPLDREFGRDFRGARLLDLRDRAQLSGFARRAEQELRARLGSLTR